MKIYGPPKTPDLPTKEHLEAMERFATGNLTEEEKDRFKRLNEQINKEYEKVEIKTNERGGS